MTMGITMMKVMLEPMMRVMIKVEKMGIMILGTIQNMKMMIIWMVMKVAFQKGIFLEKKIFKLTKTTLTKTINILGDNYFLFSFFRLILHKSIQ